MSVPKQITTKLPDTWGKQEQAKNVLQAYQRIDQKEIAKQNSDSLEALFSEDGLHTSIKKRGIAFIAGAKLILENSNPPATLSTVEAYEKYWNDCPTNSDALTTQGLRGLMLALCEDLKQKVFQNDKKKTLNNIRDKELTHAENHINWGQDKRKTLETVVYLGPDIDRDAIIQVRIDTPITRLTKTQEKQWLKILDAKNPPKWFKKFSNWERNYLIEKIEAWDNSSPPRINLGEYLGVPPTTIRGYPGARNAYQSNFYTYKRVEGGFELVSQAFKIRSGHIAPDKMKDDKELLEAAIENIKQLILAHAKEQIENGNIDLVFDLQTLITPPLTSEDRRMDAARLNAVLEIRSQLSSSGKFKQFLKENNIKPKKDGKEDGKEIDLTEIPLNFTLLTSNYPINIVRSIANFFGYIFSTRRSKENDATIGKLNELSRNVRRKALSAGTNLHDIDMARAALSQIDAISGLMQRMSNFFRRGINHNAERAALEQIACSGLGVVRIGSCMSGKDREGGVSEHMAAQIAFYGKYGKFPPIPGVGSYMRWDKDERKLREEYERMVAKEFLKGHEQAIADANASGADGLKVIGNILGSRVITQAKLILKVQLPNSTPAQAIERSKEMAELNRVKKFSANDTYRNLKNYRTQSVVVEVLKPTPLKNQFTPQRDATIAKVPIDLTSSVSKTKTEPKPTTSRPIPKN